MNYSKIIGIDVSKLTLDVAVLPDGKVFQIANDDQGIKQLLQSLAKDFNVKLSEALFAFEHTGFYSFKLATCLQDRGYAFVMLPGLELKRSLGITRGKSDKVDARKIAEYAHLRKHLLVPTVLPENEIQQMKLLLSLRDRLVSQRAGFKASIKEASRAFGKEANSTYFTVQEDMIRELNRKIEALDQELINLVRQRPELTMQFDLIVSIGGVGPQTALYMIAVTHAFHKFPNARKFCCYAGIAPFPYQSGTSILGKTRVSHLANKKIKSLLGNITGSAIQHNTEMRLYYQKRIEEGRNKMSTQNIIRNKLVARIFAVIQRGTPYVDITKFAA